MAAVQTHRLAGKAARVSAAAAAAAVVSVLKALVLPFSTLCKSVKVKGKSQYKVYEKAKQILYIVFFPLCKTVKVV